MTAQENLALVIRQSGDQKNNSARLIEESNRQADAVVAFLTSDEAVERTAKVVAFAASDWTHNDCGSDEHAFEHSNWEPYVDDARAAILAALGAESLPLDPEPWECHMKRPGELRHSLWDARMCSIPYFAPRPGYEQRREFYEKGAE